MKLLWIGEGSVTDEIRLRIPSDEFARRGFTSEVVYIPNRPFDPQALLEYKPDIAVCCRPHTYGLIERLKAHGTKIVCDIDDDFWAIPKSHVGYSAVGPGNPLVIEAMNRSMQQADLITTASSVLRDRMVERFQKTTQVVYNGYTTHMLPAWKRPSPTSERIRIGWSGTITHREDIKLCLKPMVEIAKRSGAMLVIGGDPQIYKMLHMLPEKQKLFVPMVPYEIYPQTLSYFDIGLAPLINDTFNQAKSDIKLYEFALRGIPWLASPLPQYAEWRVGGFFSTDHNSWVRNLETLVNDPALRQQLVQQAQDKLATRDEACTTDHWLKLFRGL